MTRKGIAKLSTTQAKVNTYEMLHPILEKIAFEVRELSKKKQDGVLNELKVKMINRVLTQIKDLLKSEPSAQFLDLLDTDSLPTNSDSILIISQYDAALSTFKNKYYGRDKDGSYRWFTKEEPGIKMDEN
jgi:hypothetical protein